MANPIYINASDFIETLKSQGLVIVSMAEHEAGKEIAQQRALRKKSLSCKEVADLELLGKVSKRTVNQWIQNGKIKAGEWYKEAGGKQQNMILTIAIKRLRNEN